MNKENTRQLLAVNTSHVTILFSWAPLFDPLRYIFYTSDGSDDELVDRLLRLVGGIL